MVPGWMYALLMLSVPLVQSDLIQTRFKRLTKGNGTSERILATKAFGNKFQCSHVCFQSEDCRGFHWNPQPNDRLEHNCQLLEHVHLPQIQKQDIGVELYVDIGVDCYNTSHCLGPFYPICDENMCKLICDPHQIPTEDGNCTLAAKFKRTKGTMTNLRWYKIEGEEALDYVQINEECQSLDQCGILISLDEPWSLHYDYWPLAYTFWPGNFLYVRTTSNGTFSASTYETNHTTQTKTEAMSSVVTDLGDPPYQLRVEVGSWSGLNRKVEVKVKGVDGSFATLADFELAANSSAAPDLTYYLSFVHNTNDTRTLTAPIHLKNVIKYINFTRCSAEEPAGHYYHRYSSGTCVRRRNTTIQGNYGSRANFEDMRKKRYFELTLETSSSASNIEMTLSQSSEIVFDNQKPSSTYYKIILKQIGAKMQLQLSLRRSCPTGSKTCVSGPYDAISDTIIEDQTVFDNRPHGVNISFTYATNENVSVCEVDKTVLVNSHNVTWSITIDGVDYVPGPKPTHVMDDACYKHTWFNRTIVSAPTLYNIDVLSLAGDGTKFILGSTYVPILHQS